MNPGVPLIARVECRSETEAEQRPVAVWLAGERLEFDEILFDRIEGPIEAGGPSVRQVTVRLKNRRQLELRRELPDGVWRVFG